MHTISVWKNWKIWILPISPSWISVQSEDFAGGSFPGAINIPYEKNLTRTAWRKAF